MSLLHFSEHLALPFMFADAWKSYLITLNIDVDCLLIAFEIFFFLRLSIYAGEQSRKAGKESE